MVPFRLFRWFRRFRFGCSGSFGGSGGSGGFVPAVSFRCFGFWYMPVSWTLNGIGLTYL